MQSTVRTLISQNGEHTRNEEILKEIKDFYQKLFSKKQTESANSSKHFLENLNLPKLSSAEKSACDQKLTINDLKEALLSMEGGKSPGNDGLNKEWYVFFWEAIKEPFFDSIMDAKDSNLFSTS